MAQEETGFLRRTGSEPLAARMRPRTLAEFVGQEEFIAPGRLLWRMLQADRLTSLIFYGPPGTGKTTLAYVIANQSSAEFVPTHAASIGVSEIRKIIQGARDRLAAAGQRHTHLGDLSHSDRLGRPAVLFAFLQQHADASMVQS